MKRTWLLVMLILGVAVSDGIARRIDAQEATAVGSAFLRTRQGSALRPLSLDEEGALARPLYDRTGDVILGYVYELEPQGYVVLGPDTDLVPVVAYSSDSTFRWDEDSSNVLLDLLQTDLYLRLLALEQGALSETQRAENAGRWSSMSAASSPAELPASGKMVGPLIESPTWAQGEPWNTLCPVDPTTGTRSAPGCAATALAQILSYWRYPASVTFTSSDSYVTERRHLHIDATQATLRRIEYGSKSRHNPSDTAMAGLSYAAGVSVKMDYAANGSGAYAIDIAVALAGGPTPPTDSRGARAASWDYESADVRTCVNAQWGSPFYEAPAMFYDGLRTDLDEGCPVVLFVKTFGASSGHILICDGYEASSSSDRYHLNLGWGGGTDGWYALPEDMPSGYNVVEYGVMNIHPPTSAPAPADDPSDRDPAEADPSATVAGSFVAYPNPFDEDEEVTFSYTGTLVGTHMSVTVYDLAGRLQWREELTNATEIVWEGRNEHGELLASGPYIYVIVVTDERTTLSGKGKVFLKH